MTREITIRPVLNGFVCQVGCQCVVFDSRDKLLTELKAYLNDPDRVEKEYVHNALNPMGEGLTPQDPLNRTVASEAMGQSMAPTPPRHRAVTTTEGRAG